MPRRGPAIILLQISARLAQASADAVSSDLITHSFSSPLLTPAANGPMFLWSAAFVLISVWKWARPNFLVPSSCQPFLLVELVPESRAPASCCLRRPRLTGATIDNVSAPSADRARSISHCPPAARQDVNLTMGPGPAGTKTAPDGFWTLCAGVGGQK